MKKTGGRPAKYDLEYRAKEDDAWYAVLIVLSGETMTIKYEGYPEAYDAKLAAKDFKSKEEIDEFIERFRNISPQLQDSECGSVKEGMIVCAACNAFGQDDMLFYDAVVEAIHKVNHSFHNGVEECLCTFLLSWLHGPKKDYVTTSGIEGICIRKGTAQVDPRLASFLKLANQKLGKSSCKSMSTSVQVNSASKGLSRNKSGRYLRSPQKSDSSFKGISGASCRTEAIDCNYNMHWDHDRDLGGKCPECHFMLVDNLERDLVPSSLRDFIHEQTSVLSQVYIFPCLSYMSYARGIIVVGCERKFQKLQQFLDNPNYLIVSSKGRPMVAISKRDLRRTMIKTLLGSLVYRSQDIDICQAKNIRHELILVHSGSEAYKRANLAKELFLEFITHQQRLHKKLALEEMEFLQTLQT